MSVAARYAEALLQASADTGGAGTPEAQDVATELDETVELLAREPELRLFLEHPGLSVESKRGVLREVFAPRVRGLTLNFLQLLLDKRRVRELPDIARAFRERVEAALGQDEVHVEAARPLGEAELQAIATAFERRTGKQVRLTAGVRPELIGGVRVLVGDRVLDGTLRAQLESLALRLAGRN